METVSHDGRETAYRQGRPDADGPTVLYIHGSGGTHRVWATQYGPGGPTHPAVALDLSGHGDSEDVDTTAGPETLSAYADDVCAVARATEADVLVGNSLGGAVVQRVLLKRDLAVAAAVLTGTGAKLAVEEGLRDLLATEFEAAIETLHGEDLLFHDASDQAIERSKQTMRAVGQRVTERDFLSCHTFDVRAEVADIEVPVLALVGEYDRLTPVSSHEYLAETIPTGRLALVEDAAHLAMVEQPTGFEAAISAFLSDINDETE